MPYLILGAAQLAVGAAAIFARFALGGAGALAVAAARLGIAALVLLAAARVKPDGAPPPGGAQKRLLALAGVALAAHFAGWIASLEYTTVAISTLFVATTPIFTACYDAIVLRRKLSPLALLAFAGGGAGLAMVVAFNRTAPPHPGSEWLGIALATAGSVAIAAYFILVREVRGALGTRVIVTHTYSWAALVLIAAAALARQAPPALGDYAAWGGIAAMAFVSQLLGHTALNASLRWFSPSAISFSTLLEPVSAAILALAVFHEALSPLSVAGGVVLLVSIAVFLNEEWRSGWSQPADWIDP
jgi:drug/metabolite transporter (DMT)-like permease